MSEDKFFERLRGDAARLRYEPDDDVLWTRLQARIRDRVTEEPGVAQFLARWFRPLAAALGIVLVAGTMSLAWMETTTEEPTIDSISASSLEVVMDGDSYLVSD